LILQERSGFLGRLGRGNRRGWHASELPTGRDNFGGQSTSRQWARNSTSSLCWERWRCTSRRWRSRIGSDGGFASSSSHIVSRADDQRGGCGEDPGRSPSTSSESFGEPPARCVSREQGLADGLSRRLRIFRPSCERRSGISSSILEAGVYQTSAVAIDRLQTAANSVQRYSTKKPVDERPPLMPWTPRKGRCTGRHQLLTRSRPREVPLHGPWKCLVEVRLMSKTRRRSGRCVQPKFEEMCIPAALAPVKKKGRSAE